MAFTVYSPIRVLGLGDLDNAKVDGTINPPRQGQGVARLLGGIAYPS